MKGFAYAILIVVMFSLILQPLIEVIHVTTEKEKISAALRNSGKAAVLRSVGDKDRGDMNGYVNTDIFIKRFNESFSKALNLTLSDSGINESTFSCNDDKFNNFKVTFKFYEEPDEITSYPNGYCDINITTKYKYIMGYLKAAERAFSSFDSFCIHCENTFSVSISN